MERVRSLHWVLALMLMFMWVAWVHFPAAVAQDSPYDCGPLHAGEVRLTLRLRDPGAVTSSSKSPDALILDRALIIEDFRRLPAEQRGAVDSPLRRVDDERLRSARDSGSTSADVCAVVRFMHDYYLSRGQPTLDVASSPPVEPAARPPGLGARAAQQELQPELPPPPRPPTKAVARRASASKRAQVPEPAPAPAAEPQVAASVRRDALAFIAEIDRELKVPPYLTFREVQIKVPMLARDELDQRQAASLRASERVVTLLNRLTVDPTLREAVQESLGPEGRARLEDGIQRAFKSVPDAEQRAGALDLWSELEASAKQKR